MKNDSWRPFDGGSTIGTIGSENGTIIRDEVHPDGARITLERDGYQPFSITCGCANTMVHTAFASTEAEALTKYESMKQDVSMIVTRDNQDQFYEDIQGFIDKY